MIKNLELWSGMRERKAAKTLFCQLAVKKIGYPGAKVARYVKVATSPVDRLAVSEETPDLKKYLKMLWKHLRSFRGRKVLLRVIRTIQITQPHPSIFASIFAARQNVTTEGRKIAS